MKSSGNPPPSLLKFCLLMLMLVSYTDTFVIGAPKGAQVVSGTASFTQEGNLTVITAGNRSVINYTGFDIGKNETVQFIQPGAHATVLNRVTTPDPTNIFGQLQSNGIVIISNPYGVFFQNGSVVNVGGLIAGAGKISDADFAAGKIHFTDLTGDVRNDGVVAADNRIALLGANVANTGSMTAAHGVAMMVSGPDVYVGDKNGNVFVQANGKALKAAAAATGTAAASAGSVSNSGKVAAPRVVLGAGDMYSTAIVNSGLLQGRSIAVNAGKNGSSTVGGTLDASSAHNPTATGKGGNIDVLGGKVALQGATLDASGQAGGGNVRVGGDFHGANTLLAATTTSIDAATTIKADATGATGSGGTIALWSEKGTSFLGRITARAGSNGGDGGQVEISSHAGLGYNGTVDAGAANGKPGSLLLDPTNIEISSTSGNPLTSQTINPADTPTGTDANGTYVIAASAIENSDPGTALTLQASQDFRVDSLTGQVGVGNLFGVKTVGQLAFPAPLGTLTNPLTPVVTPITLVAGGSGQGSFVMANTADTLVTNGRPLTITANGVTTPGGINTGNTNAIQLGNINTLPGGALATAAGVVTLLDTLPIPATNPPAILPSFPVQVGGITTTSATGVGGAINITYLPPTTNAGVTTHYYAPTSISTGLLNTSTTTQNGGAGGNITLTALGSVTVGGAITTGTADASTAGYLLIQPQGGAVQLQSTVNTGTTNSGGPGGDVVIGSIFVPTSISITGQVTTGTAGTGNSGQVYLVSSGPLTLSNTVSTAAVNGTGGKVTLTIDNTNTTTAAMLTLPGISTGGALGGGDIVVANNNTVTGSNLTISGALSTISTGNGATSGNVSLTAPAITVSNSILTNAAGAAASASNGGNVTLTAPAITINNPITTTGTATGMSGAVLLDSTSTDPTTTVGLNSTITAGSLTTGAGTTTFNDGSAVTTNGNGQTYGGPVVLNQTAAGKMTTLADTGGGNVQFSATVDSASTSTGQNLTVNTSGNEIFGGAVGSAFSLNNLTTDAAGTVGGAAKFNLALPTGTTNLAGVTLTGALSVDDGVNFGVTGGAGVTAPSISTGGAQTYTGAATVGATTYLTSGSTLTFSSTVGSATATGQALTLDTAGTITLGGGVGTGALNPLASLTTVRGQEVDLNGGGVSTNGATGQVYSGAVVLGSDNTLTATGNGPVDFVSTVSGAHALTVATSGLTTFGGNMGGGVGTALTSLNVSSGGTSFTPTTAGAALTVTTTGTDATTTNGQTYHGAVTLGTDVTLNAGSKPVDFVSTVDGAHALTVATSGLTTFGGNVGGGTGTALTSLNVSSGGTSFTPSTGTGPLTVTTTGTNATTTNGQTYNGAVTLGADTTLNAGSKPVDFVSTVDGTHALTVATSGLTTFGGNVGGGVGTALTSLNVSSGGTSFTPSTGTGPLAVTTTGANGQTYHGAVTLGADTTLAAGAAPVNFVSTVDGTPALTVTTSGVTTFGGNVGGGVGTALTSLNVSSGGTSFTPTTAGAALTVTTTGTDATTTNGQTYHGAVTLGTDVTLNAGSKPVDFVSTVSSATANGATTPESLSVITSGTTIFGGAVGGTLGTNGLPTTTTAAPALASLSVTGGGAVDINGGSVTTVTTSGGTQTYGTSTTPDQVVLGADTTFTGYSTVFTSGITEATAGTYSLTLNLTSQVTLPDTGLLANIKDFSSIGSGGVDITGDISTYGSQTYSNGPVIIDSASPNVLLHAGTGTTASSIILNSTVNDSTTGTHNLTLEAGQAGGVTINGAIGATHPLLSLTATTGVSSFATPPSQTETVTINGVAVTTTGSQAYGVLNLGTATGPLTTLHSNALTGPSAITAVSVTGNGHPLTVNVDSATGTTNFGAITGAGALNFGVPGTSTFSTISDTAPVNFTGGSVDFTGAVGASTVGINASGTATFGGTLAASGAVTVNGTGATIFDQAVTAASLSVTNGSGVTLSGGNTGGTTNTVQTTAGQTYGETLTLGADTTLADTNKGTITLGAVNSNTTTAQSLTVSTGGITVFGGVVGATPLSSLQAGLAGAANLGGTTQITGGAITTTGAQTYNDAVTLGITGATIAAPLTTTLKATTAADITFNNTLDGNAAGTQALVVNSPGNEVFNQRVGATALASLTTDNGGSLGGQTTLGAAGTDAAPSVTTTGIQHYFDPVVLAANTVLKAGSLALGSTLDGSAAHYNLTLTIANAITINGGTNFGANASPARALGIINNIGNFVSNGAGTTAFNGDFETYGSQTFTTKTLLDTNVAFRSDNNADISFAAVDSDTATDYNSLTVNTGGTTTFNGQLGATNPLGGVTTDAGGFTVFAYNGLGNAVQTVNNGTAAHNGAQSYNDTVSLLHDTTLQSRAALPATAGGSIGFGSTGAVNGPGGLTLDTTGATSFAGTVGGGTTPLASLTIVGSGAGTTVSTNSITTVGAQTYGSPLLLGNNVTLTSTGTDPLASAITFNSTLQGAFALTTTTSGGNTVFGVNSGSVPASLLTGLTTSANGTTIFNNAALTTNGTQTYHGPVVVQSVGRALSLTAATGNIVFDKTLNSTKANSTDLSLTTTAAGSSVTFTGAVGGTTTAPSDTALNSLTVTSPTTHIDGGVVNVASSNPRGIVGTDGTQTYHGAVDLGMGTTLVGTTVTATGVIDGQGNDLTLTLSGLATVPLAGLINVHNFTSNGTGGTLLNGTFTTTGTQTYSNNVSLAGTPILTSVGNLTFNNPVDGNAPLTLNATGPGAQVVFTTNALVGNTTGIGALTTNSVGGTVFGMNAGSSTIGIGKGGVNAASVTVASGPVFFDVTGGTTAHPSILTTGAQTYQGAATLQQDTLLTSSNGGAISFAPAAATIDSDNTLPTQHSLTLATTGTQTFTGLIGSNDPLSSLTTGTGTTVFNMNVGTALAGVRINGPLVTGGAVSFNEAGSSLTNPSVLTLNNGAQTYGGVVTLLGAVTVLNSANTEPTTGTFHGGGVITFDGNIVSGVPVNVTAGTPELDVRAGAGTIEFDAPITTTGDFAPGGASVVFKGTIGPVGTFTVLPNDLNTGLGGIDINGGSVTTGGSQIYNFNTVLSRDTVMQAGGNITFVKTLDGSNNPLDGSAYTLDLKLTGSGSPVVAFDGIVGGLVPLKSLTTENVGATVGTTQFNMVLPLAGTGKGGVNVINAVNIGTNADFETVGLAGGTVPTILSGVTYRGQVGTGTQTYGGAVTLGLSGVLHQTTVLQDIAAAGSITFNGRVNGQADGDAGLSVNSNGDEVFNQLVGDAHTLASLSTDDVSGGTGSARFSMDLTQTGAAAGVRVAGTVNVNDLAAFNATGGLVHPTILSGGAQNYALAATVNRGTVLTIDPALRTAGLPADNGNVIFQSTVDSGATAQDLQVNTPGNEIFKGLVGYTSPLASLTTDATGPATGQTRFLMTLPTGNAFQNNPGGVNVSGNVTVNDGVFFQVANSFTLFEGTDYTPSVISGGTQTYVGPATLGGATVLVSTNGNVAFNSTVDSNTLAPPQPLTIVTPAAGSAITFAQAVGGTFPLASLTTAGTGTTQINGGSVTTTGEQQYEQAVTLGQDTTLLSTDANGSIVFDNSLDGNHNLTINAPAVNLEAVGNTSPLLNLTVNAPSGANFYYVSGIKPGNGAVNLAGRLTVNGPTIFRVENFGDVVFVRTGVTVPGFNLTSGQDYFGTMLLQGSATFTDLKSGPISFHQTVDGFGLGTPADLTVSTGGTISFFGSVGGTAPLSSLITSNLGVASGQTVISGGSVTTMVNTNPGGGSGAQTYNDAVVLGTGTTLTSLPSADPATGTTTTGGDIVFASTLNSNGAATPQALVVNTSGRTVFGGAVGTINALASLTTDNEGPQDLGTFINGGSVTTVSTGAPGVTGAQTYNDAVTLGATTTLTSNASGSAATGGKIAFNSTLDSNGAATPQALTINTSGQTVFGGAVGAMDALASLTTDNEGPQDQGTLIKGGSVTTTGAQTYNDAAALGAATTLTSKAGGDIVFASTLNSNGAATPQALVVNTSGRTVFGGAVGTINALASLTTDNEGPQDLGTFINGGSVTTTGAQTYNDGVTLGANAVLASRANGALVFNNTVNGAFTLTLNTGGLTIFNRAVGGVIPLAGLTTDNAGAAGEGTQFNMTVGTNAAGVVVNGPITINDAVLFNVKGSSLTQPGVLTLGNTFSQTYNGLATLGTSTFLVSAAAPSIGGVFTGGGSILFNSPQGIVANGGSDLSVRAGVGTDALAAAVNVGTLDLGGASATFRGPITLPGTLSVEPNDATGGGSIAFTGPTLTTTGAQVYNAAFILGVNTVATSTGGGTITFNSTVDGPFALTLNTKGDEVFNGRVGGTTALASLTTDDPADTVGGHVIFNVAGSTSATPSVTTTGRQTYNDAAILRADTVLASTGGGTLTFASTVDSDSTATPRVLTLNSAGDQIFNGQVGSMAPLASLTTDDPAANITGGRTIFDVASGTPSVTTTGLQAYNDAVVLQAGTTLASLGGGALTFVSTLDGPASLTLRTAGQTTFRGAVGSGIALASLTTQGGGGIAINGRTVTTTGLQSYGGVTTLGADTVLTSTATGGGIFFATTLDSDTKTTARALTLNAVGNETFNGRVGGNAPLASLTTDDPAAGVSGGSVIFNVGGSTPDAPSVVTTGFQTYHDAALLQTATVLASTASGTLTFNSTVDGPFALTLNSAGNEVFGGTVGGIQALASLTTDANSAGGQVIFGLAGASAALTVTTTGAQTYNDAALLQTGTTLTGTNGGTLTFASTVDGPFALSLNSKGDEVFDGQIGHLSALASLSTDADAKNAGGNVRFFFTGTNASPSVTTTGAQAYHDPAVLHADTVLASTGGGRLAFLSTVDNSNVTNLHALTLNSSGDEFFGGLIGAAKAIGSLATDAAGPTGGQAQFAMDLTGQTGNNAGANVNGSVTINDAVSFNAPGASTRNVLVQSTGAQVYNRAATVAADAVLASSGGSAITFNSTVVGPRALTINTGGTTTFNGTIGSGPGNALAGLSTQGGPVTLNAGTVTTTGAQNFAGAATLGQDTLLTSSADGVTFGSTVDGTHALTMSTAGTTTFNGVVGGTNPLTNLTAMDGSGVIVNGGRVATLGLQTYGGQVAVNRPDGGTTILLASNDETSSNVAQHGNLDFRQNVIVNSGSLLVQGRRILAEPNANVSVAGAGSLNLEASDVLILRGTGYGSDSGSVTLNDPQNGLAPVAVNNATIFLTNQRTTFHGGSFDMGYLQNMYSQGSVFITVGNGTAALSDIAATGSINVSAGAIVLHARNADPARGGTGGGTDDGLNFVAQTSINFGNSPIRYDNTNSTNDVANFVTTSGLATVNRDQAVGISLFQDPSLGADFAQRNTGLNFNDANFGSFSGFPLQPISGGTQTIDTAAALSGALPDQKPLDVAVDITVTAGQLEELKKLGIHPRRAAKQERLSLNSKRALFAQLVDGQDQENYGLLQPIKGGVSRLVPSDYVVVVDRMSEREVQSILTAFEQLYGKNKEKAAPIGESFNTAFTDYTTEKQTGDPAGFAPYLVEKPGKYPEVDKAVRGFDNLFGYIESLGLTNKEQAKSKEHIASDLQVAGVSPEDMVKVIDTLRTKIPKNQKASSTKLPPSPPVTAPAPGATNPPAPVQKATPPLKTARQPVKDPARKTVRQAKPVKEDRLHEVAGL